MSKKQNEVMGSTGIRFTAEQLKRCDEKSTELGISRNEFIREAVEFYLEWLSRESSEKFLTPAFESVISAKLRDTEDRLSRILFKMAVEQNILTHYLMTDPNEQIYIEDLRSMAVQELKETNGTLGISNILTGNRTLWQDCYSKHHTTSLKAKLVVEDTQNILPREMALNFCVAVWLTISTKEKARTDCSLTKVS